MRNRQLIALWAYEHGKANNVIEKIDNNGKTAFIINDFQALRALFAELLAEVQRIKSEGDYAAAQALVEEYGVKVDPTLHAEVLERYDESGKFAHAKDYFIHLVASPFEFWEGLSEFLSAVDSRPLQKIYQPDAYRYLLEYVKKTVSDVNESRLKELLAMDFSANEHKNAPYFLK